MSFNFGSPYSPPHRQQGQARAQRYSSPMNLPSPGNDNDFDFSLRLPPINHPDSNHFAPHLPSPIHFAPERTSSSNSSTSREQLPPPSNQQARRYQTEHYQSQSDSPDSLRDLFGTPSYELETDMAPQRTTASVVDLTESSPPLAAKKRKRDDSTGEGRAVKTKNEGDPSRRQRLSNVEVVDLENVKTRKEYEEFQAKQQEEAIKKQNEEEANRPMKLAEFQCIICMDNPTDLTVTHCGHLFCSECLHSALHAGDKKNCPVCRTTIVTTRAGKPSKNGIFHLEMKLMTANKKGKQPVRAR